MKLIKMLNENGLSDIIQDTTPIKNLSIDEYVKENENCFIVTKGLNKYKVYVHNYWKINNGKIAWCYSIEKLVDGLYTPTFRCPKSIAWLGTIMTKKQKLLIPDVE